MNNNLLNNANFEEIINALGGWTKTSLASGGWTLISKPSTTWAKTSIPSGGWTNKQIGV